MMNKLKELLNSYFFLIVIVFLILVAGMSFSIYRTYQAGRFNQAVERETNQANTAVKTAANANLNAANFDMTRRTEDAVREKSITPKLENSRIHSQTSKIELDLARTKYRNEKLHTENLDSSDADNCRELRVLFPDTRFADCS